MEDRAIVPDCQVILVPLEADLEVMVLCNQLKEVRLDDFALPFCHSVYPALLNLMPSSKQALPAGHWIRPHNRMRSFEVQARVLWRPTFIFDELSTEGLRDPDKIRLMMGCSQALSKFLPNRREPVVRLVARSP